MVTTNHKNEHKNGARQKRGYWSGLLAGLLAGLSIGVLSGAAAMVRVLALSLTRRLAASRRECWHSEWQFL